mgnify:CR=1 FL=1
MEITTLRLVLRRGFVLSVYIPGDYNVFEREERIPMLELSPETNGEERERWKPSPCLVVGGGLYRVHHPLTSYVTKRGMNAIILAHYQALTTRMIPTALVSTRLRISE